MESSDAGLSPLHKQHLLVTFQYIDKLLSDIERVLSSTGSSSPFRSHVDDVLPAQRKLIASYIARLRAQVLRAMEHQSIDLPEPQVGALHSIDTNLSFIDVAVEEMRPKYLKGYGYVPDAAAAEMEGLVEELEALIERFQAALKGSTGEELEARLHVLADRGIDNRLLQLLNRIIADYGLVEFRPRFNAIVNRFEDRRFEIALFGRVSSGKSSLLNALLGDNILPVGVTPITAVPTRITCGPQPDVLIWFADGRSEQCEVSRLAEFVAEPQNPGNSKHVARLLVTLPAARLREGVVLVDTPGLGSLATAGAAETMAYLPQCDLGIVLVDAASTLTEDDLATIQRLNHAGIECHVLISKADLLSEDELSRFSDYVRRHVHESLGLQLPIQVVSSRETHRGLVEKWFSSEILPLYEQHEERSRKSLWKKVLLLKEAVEATLRIKSRRAVQKAEAAAIGEKEKALRAGATAIVDSRRQCEGWIRQFPELIEPVLAGIAEKIAASLKNGTAQANVAHPAEIAVAEVSGVVLRRLETLNKTLVSILQEVAASLKLTAPSGEEFASLLREMPRFDISGIQFEPGAGLRLLGSHVAEMRLRGSLHRQIGKQLADALHSYSQQLDIWCRNVLHDIERQFEGNADIYRSQLSMLGSQQAVSHGDDPRLQADLTALEGWQAEPQIPIIQQ